MAGRLSKLKQLRRHPSLLIGLVLIAILVGMSLYAIIAIPYPEAVRLWRDPGDRIENPVLAQPVWFDWFTPGRMPRTMVIGLEDEGVTLTEVPLGDGMKRMEVEIPFTYEYDGFPSELRMDMRWSFEPDVPRPLVSMYWRKPDGELIMIAENVHTRGGQTLYISGLEDLRQRLGMRPEIGLFVKDPTVPREERVPMQGTYEFIVQGEFREGHSLDDVSLTVYGRVHGLSGTDNRRRDLLLPLLWGAFVALAFGILAALAFQLGNVLLALMGRRYRERVDPLFRRLTDVNIILLLLPVLIVISRLYALSEWAFLGLVIAVSVIMAVIRVLRAVFAPLAEAPHSGPARSSRSATALLLPSFLLTVPAFVFLQAALGLFGLGDPYLPTWGKVLNDAFNANALQWGHHYWIIQPLVILIVLGIGFAMAGYALHRIYNPRLQTER